MTARDDILAAVRDAVATAPPAPVAEVPRRPSDAEADLVALFVARVADYRAVVERCTAADLEATVRAALPDGARVVVPRRPRPRGPGLRSSTTP